MLMAAAGLFAWGACSLDAEALTGHWQAVAYYENGQTKAAPLDSIRLRFLPGSGYEFTSQGLYHESGTFRVSVKYLFFTDSTQYPAKSHVVKVLYLSPDSLKIQMAQENVEQVLFFVRRQ